jgi:hypothetical protein
MNRLVATALAGGMFLVVDRAPETPLVPSGHASAPSGVVSRTGQTAADMANGPQQRVLPYVETVALLEKLGWKNNHKCVSC